MTQNLLIHEITPETPLWTCKVQIVDIYGPAESKERKVKYLNMIVQDEQEYQTKATVYADDIPNYQKRIKLYHTFRITGGRAQPPYLRYEKPLSAFNWVLDKKSIIDPIKTDDVDALPPPTKLNITSFADIKRNVAQTMATDLTKKEFDILAIVVNCSPPRYVATVEKRLQELIVVDMFKQNLTFTIWEEGIIENEGRKLLHQFREYPVILARRIGASRYNGVSLTTKFDTTIQIDPPYPQRRELQAWVTENRQILTSFTLRSTSTSGFLLSVPMDEEIVPIASIDSQQDGHTFTVEAKITFPTDLKKFYVLVCSNCGQDVRYPTVREIDCMNCDQKNLLVPRCRFDIDLTDDSGSTIGIIMDKEGEKLLSLTAEEIYKRASDPGNYPSLEDVRANISNKLFHVRAKKAFARASRTTSVKLYIHSCVEKQSFTDSLSSPSTINTHEASKRKQKVHPPHITEEAGSLKMKQKLDPATPKKTN